MAHNPKGSNMPSHASPKTQSARRFYRVVAVAQDGRRMTLSEHNSFLAAEQARKMMPSEDGLEIRIESAVDMLAAVRPVE